MKANSFTTAKTLVFSLRDNVGFWDDLITSVSADKQIYFMWISIYIAACEFSSYYFFNKQGSVTQVKAWHYISAAKIILSRKPIGLVLATLFILQTTNYVQIEMNRTFSILFANLI